jgi:hypothetical protein
MKIVICPKCDQSSELSHWGSIPLSFDLMNEEEELVCPKCLRLSKKKELTLGFTGISNVQP